MRADAARNRAAILATTTDLLTSVGPDLTIESVAERAGVGVGTIYRHFPDRVTLIREVITGLAATMGELVERCAALSEDHPAAAWQQLFDGFLDTRFGHLLPAILPLARQSEFFDAETVALRAATFAKAERILANAQRAEVVRDDVSLIEIVLLISSALHTPPDLPAWLTQKLVPRRAALIASALRPDPASPLPGTPVSSATLFEIFSPPSD